jgi:hypothetical protein
MKAWSSVPCSHEPLLWTKWTNSTPSHLSWFFKTHFNINSTICVWVFQVVSSLCISPPYFCMPLPYLFRPSHLPWSHCPKILGEEYRLRSSSVRSFLRPPLTSSLSGPNILHTTTFLNFLNLSTSRNARNQVPRLYKTMGHIVLFPRLIFTLG